MSMGRVRNKFSPEETGIPSRALDTVYKVVD